MKKQKHSKAISIIGGADGPTSVFLAGKLKKHTWKQKFWKLTYKIKRWYVEKTITNKNHSIHQVGKYIIKKYGFVEVDAKSPEYLEEYQELRASFLVQYAPQLLGEYANIPKIRDTSKENIQQYIEQCENRLKRAKEIPQTEFDIDFHKFQRVFDNSNDRMDIVVEKKYAYIGGGATGNKKMVREFHKIYKDVYKFYGVTQKDINNKTKRYEDLLRTLCE